MSEPAADKNEGDAKTRTLPTESREKLGKYEIVEKIGDGGFGVVYKGYDPFIKRNIALKTCTSPDREIRERFFREAEISGKLDHPNIVRVLDFGLHDETPFMVQEFLVGENLEQKIRDRQFLAYSEQLLILIQIARALEYAHSMGVIHRDVKPSNIQILDDGTAKIMDFGIAILQQMDSKLTKEGMTVGTAAYLAPEQIRGESADPRTDIFSYGVLAYELVTGKRPFGKETISATFYEILNDDPKPLSTSQCPNAMRGLIHRCLQKDPHLRYTDFQEVLLDLADVREQLQEYRRSSALTRTIRRDLPDQDTVIAPTSVQERPLQPRPPRVSEVKYEPPSDIYWARSKTGRSRRKDLIAALVLFTAVVLSAAGVYWWLLRQELAPPFHELATTIKAGGGALVDDMRQAVTTSPESDPSPEPAVADDTESPAQEPESIETEGTAEEPVSPETAAETASEEAIQPTAEPPRIPFQNAESEALQATLVIARGWHKGMTVSVDGGPAMTLARPKNLELEPGKHVLRFALRTPRYRTTRMIDVDLAAGEKVTVRSPIFPPGQLSAHPRIGSPQGIVQIEGEDLGATPIRGHILEAGTYRLKILPVGDPSGSPIEASVSIQGVKETLVTFDLTGEQEMQVRHRKIER